MADEAYRAVFLRVHPTGKMVLSLTTEADGNEGALRAARRRRARRARRSTSRSCPADENRFGSGHGFNTEPVRRRRRRRSPARREKIRAKAQLLAGVALETPADDLRWDDGAFVGAAGARTIADIALYAHGSGALPPGVEGGLDAQTVYRD